MIREGAQQFSENQAVADGGFSAVIDLGFNTGYYDAQPWLDVILTAGGGSLTAVKIQTSGDEAFGAPLDVMTVSVPATVDQTVPAYLIQMKLPRGMRRWARLVYSGAGTVTAGLTTGAPV